MSMCLDLHSKFPYWRGMAECTPQSSPLLSVQSIIHPLVNMACTVAGGLDVHACMLPVAQTTYFMPRMLIVQKQACHMYPGNARCGSEHLDVCHGLAISARD